MGGWWPARSSRLPHVRRRPGWGVLGGSPSTGAGSVITPRTRRSLVAKLSFLAGFGAGYVLGARAGRERYEQIRRAYQHAKDDPRLQSAAGMAQARADAAVNSAKTRLGNETGNHNCPVSGWGRLPPRRPPAAPGPPR